MDGVDSLTGSFTLKAPLTVDVTVANRRIEEVTGGSNVAVSSRKIALAACRSYSETGGKVGKLCCCTP